MSLQGSLKHIQLHDVIQLVSVSGKSGLFHLKKGNEEGKIYLKNGNIVHAEVGELKGEEAIYTLAVWSEGEFNFEPDVECQEETIKKSNTNLLMEAARRLDEWKVLTKKIPSLKMIPKFKPQPITSKAHIHLNTGEWLVLSKVNDSRNIEEIAKEINLSTFDTSKILYGLITNNLIELREPSMPVEEELKEKKEEEEKASEESKEMPQAQVAIKEEVEKTSGKIEKEKIFDLLDKIRDISEQILGNQGRAVILKQYEKAKMDIESGKGMDAIKETITYIARASSILKGPSTTELLLDQIRKLKIS